MGKCNCNMYREKGRCFHTGYNPLYEKRPRVRRVLPAIERMENRIKHPSEIAEEKDRTRGISPR